MLQRNQTYEKFMKTCEKVRKMYDTLLADIQKNCKRIMMETS